MKSLLVIGSINMDLVYSLERIPNPGESLPSKDFLVAPGGKGANQAFVASKLGNKVKYIGSVGNDIWGNKLKGLLINNDIEIDLKISSESTGTAVIMLEKNGENRIIVNNGANDDLKPKDIEEKLTESELKNHSIILIQLEIPIETIEYIIKKANKANIPVVVDAGPSKKCNLKIFDGVKILSPNESELSFLLDKKFNSLEDIKKGLTELKDKSGAENIVMKLGKNGSLLYDGNKFKKFEPYHANVIDTTGAGDGFTAALASSLANKLDIENSIKYANAVGALMVENKGVYNSMLTNKEVTEFLEEQEG
ncbi:MAG: ribokinase [Candidatus Frackibacter sp. T328-2]|nr:MAG: ribokinase [Candidatus Frackibacter sp. T328-2]